VVRGRLTIYREDLNLFDRFLREATGFDATPLDAIPETAGITNGVLAPLFVRQQPWGLLAVVSRSLTPADAAAVTLFATQVASSMEVAESIEALEAANVELAARSAELSRAQEELVKRERLAALGELAAIVAHEVRNPIGVLFNSIGALRKHLEAKASPRRRESVNVLMTIMGEEADRLNRIVSDLLDFARPNSPSFRNGSLRDVVEEAVAAAEREGAEAQVEVLVEVPRDFPCVGMDPRFIRQALLNLLTNGFQAMPKKGRLAVRAVTECRGDMAFARVDITDTGPGIPDEIRSRIFEPFFTTKASGTGLGLSVVKRIIDAHGGEISVASTSTETTFTLRLPLDLEARAPTVAAPAPAPDGSTSSA
jgi:signal transduction histidine kinase